MKGSMYRIKILNKIANFIVDTFWIWKYSQKHCRKNGRPPRKGSYTPCREWSQIGSEVTEIIVIRRAHRQKKQTGRQKDKQTDIHLIYNIILYFIQFKICSQDVTFNSFINSLSTLKINFYLKYTTKSYDFVFLFYCIYNF